MGAISSVDVVKTIVKNPLMYWTLDTISPITTREWAAIVCNTTSRGRGQSSPTTFLLP